MLWNPQLWNENLVPPRAGYILDGAPQRTGLHAIEGLSYNREFGFDAIDLSIEILYSTGFETSGRVLPLFRYLWIMSFGEETITAPYRFSPFGDIFRLR